MADSQPDPQPPLSLTAQYDDLCRLTNSFISMDEDDCMILMFKNLEECRLKWALSERNLAVAKDKVLKQQDDIKCLQQQLSHVRQSYAAEIQKREAVQKERDKYRCHIDLLRKFILEDPMEGNSQSTREKVLSYINLHRLEPVLEGSRSSEEDSDGVGIEFDKTTDSERDTLDNRSRRRSSHGKRKSSTSKDAHQRSGAPMRDSSFSPTKTKSPKRTRTSVPYMDEDVDDDAFKMDLEMADSNNEIILARDRSLSEPVHQHEREIDVEEDIHERHGRGALYSDSVAIELNNHGKYYGKHASSPHMGARDGYAKTVPRTLTPQDITRINRDISNLSRRPHQFVQKKNFVPDSCGGCKKRIGFCTDYYRCNECYAMCHLACKDKVPVPCIPVAVPKPGHNNRKRLIGDCVDPKMRPAIPALIVHCCNEIEKRGLDEEGLYRKCGSAKEVDDLMKKVVDKKGMPILSDYDVHVLCSAVKKFLSDLHESLVTTVLWRDFVRAAEQENKEDERALILQAVSELPTANRDSLAFLIVHLQKIASSPKVMMDHKNLARCLGPTIVGYSMQNIPGFQIKAEALKQQKVLSAMLDIPQEEWNNFISTNPRPYTPTFTSSDRRLSVGTRLFGGIVQKGALTPQRKEGLPPRQSSNFTLKPMF